MSNVEARVLALVGEVSNLLDLYEFRGGLLAALRREIPSDYASLNQIALEAVQVWSVAEPPLPAEDHKLWGRLAMQNPLAARHMQTRDGRPRRLSDLVTREQLHATDLYRDLYAHLEVEYQVAFTLPSASDRVLAIALSRSECDFTDNELDLLALARPHLIQAYRNALDVTDMRSSDGTTPGPDEHALRALGLTPTQATVLRQIATGASTTQIAADLQIAPRTVHKHLQRIYKKLEVNNRASAAARAWASNRDERR